MRNLFFAGSLRGFERGRLRGNRQRFDGPLQGDLQYIVHRLHEVQFHFVTNILGNIRQVPLVVPWQHRLQDALPVRSELRTGGFARGVFLQTDRQVPAAPEAAIRYDAEGASVMVLDNQNRVRRAPVRTGARAGGWVELVQGPPAGSRRQAGQGGASTLQQQRAASSGCSRTLWLARPTRVTLIASRLHSGPREHPAGKLLPSQCHGAGRLPAGAMAYRASPSVRRRRC